jgi:hypothetical protein
MSSIGHVNLQPLERYLHGPFSLLVTFSKVLFLTFKKLALQTGQLFSCILHFLQMLWPYEQIMIGGRKYSKHTGHSNSIRSSCVRVAMMYTVRPQIRFHVMNCETWMVEIVRCVYKCTYIHTHTHTHTHTTHTYKHTHIYTLDMHTHTHTHTRHACMHFNSWYTCIHVRMCVCVCVCMSGMYVCVYVCMYGVLCVYACLVCICMHACIHTYIHTYGHVYKCISC